jgi:uncharacterized repeat protein (TIGR03803 family)
MTNPVSGRKALLALLMRLLWAAALALSAFGAKAGVVFTSLHSFTGGNDGGDPGAALVRASDGCLYGTTVNGGANSNGTIFRITCRWQKCYPATTGWRKTHPDRLNAGHGINSKVRVG